MADDNDIRNGDSEQRTGELKGIYSTEEKASIGAGMTRRAAQRKRYWAVWAPAAGEDSYVAQSLNQNLIPTGPKRRVSSLEFKERFRLEPDFFVDVNADNIRHLWETEQKESKKFDPEPEPRQAPRGERRTIFDDERPRRAPEERPREEPSKSRRDLRDKEPLLREGEESTRSPLNEEQLKAIEAERNARAGYGLGMSHLKRGNMDKAKELLRRVAVEDGDYIPEHKHMFNEFGVGLRKNQLLDIALLHMRRALSLAPYDEHIYHNMARLYYEKGDKAMAIKHLEKSLELNPEFKESQQFLKYINKHASKPKKKLRFKI